MTNGVTNGATNGVTNGATDDETHKKEEDVNKKDVVKNKEKSSYVSKYLYLCHDEATLQSFRRCHKCNTCTMV